MPDNQGSCEPAGPYHPPEARVGRESWFRSPHRSRPPPVRIRRCCRRGKFRTTPNRGREIPACGRVPSLDRRSRTAVTLTERPGETTSCPSLRSRSVALVGSERRSIELQGLRRARLGCLWCSQGQRMVNVPPRTSAPSSSRSQRPTSLSSMLSMQFLNPVRPLGESGGEDPVTSFTYVKAPTEFVEVDGPRAAFRTFGKDDGVPILLLNHCRAEMDHRDPLVTDGLALGRRAILYDYRGVASGNSKIGSFTEPRIWRTTRALPAVLSCDQLSTIRSAPCSSHASAT